ncbi:aldo/keto reductase [bacterium]|nr:aldo/keto reductase [bacterium]
MEMREFGRTGWSVSAVGFGAWAVGGSWGRTDDSESMAALHRSLDLGVNFFDTADVYGDGHSERLLARLKRERREPFFTATKAGRRLDPHTAEGYHRANLTAFIERSLKNLEADSLDLLQLHCPPSAVYNRPEVFGILDDLTAAGKIRHYGVSVETVEEAIQSLAHPNVMSVQIIFNIFRTKPAEIFFAEAKRRRVAVLARVPLASGLLTGKMTASTAFAPDDHRAFNRKGEAFDRGETFSGIDYETGLAAVEELKKLLPAGVSLARFALRWILMFDAVSCVIPGGRRPSQAEENASAADLPPLTEAQMRGCREIYDRLIRPQVHHLW